MTSYVIKFCFEMFRMFSNVFKCFQTVSEQFSRSNHMYEYILQFQHTCAVAKIDSFHALTLIDTILQPIRTLAQHKY